MNRYEDADELLVSIFIRTVEERFPFIGQLKVKLLYDTKKRINKGKLVLISTELANPKLKHISKDNVAVEGYDYIVIVDKKAFELSDDTDRKRLMSHALRHIFIDENDSLKIIDHDISDFRMEVVLNKDNPDWCDRLTEKTGLVYDQMKDMKKDTEYMEVQNDRT